MNLRKVSRVVAGSGFSSTTCGVVIVYQFGCICLFVPGEEGIVTIWLPLCSEIRLFMFHLFPIDEKDESGGRLDLWVVKGRLIWHRRHFSIWASDDEDNNNDLFDDDTICVSWRLKRLLRVSLNIIESLSQRLLLLLVSYCFILLKVLWHLPTSKQCPIESQNISQPLKDYVLDVFSPALASFPRNNSYRKQPPQPHLFNRGASVWRGLWRVPWIKSWMSEQLQSEVLWRDRTNGIEDLMVDQFAGSE